MSGKAISEADQAQAFFRDTLADFGLEFVAGTSRRKIWDGDLDTVRDRMTVLAADAIAKGDIVVLMIHVTDGQLVGPWLVRARRSAATTDDATP